METQEDQNASSVPIGEAAAYVGVSVDTMRRWTRSGQVKAVRTPGGQFRYYLRDLDELMAARTHGPA